MEQALQPVVLAILDWVNAEVHLCQQLDVFDVLQLVYLPNIVQAQIQELEALYAFKSTKAWDLILWKIQRSKNWKCFESFDLSEIIGTDEKLFDPESFQILYPFDSIAIER